MSLSRIDKFDMLDTRKKVWGMVEVKGQKFRCQVEFAVHMIRGKWKVDMIWLLKDRGMLRFNELKRLIPGITQRILAQQLDELEFFELVERKIYPEAPPRVEYMLTPSGEAMAGIFAEFIQWTDQHIALLNGEESPSGDGQIHCGN